MPLGALDLTAPTVWPAAAPQPGTPTIRATGEPVLRAVQSQRAGPNGTVIFTTEALTQSLQRYTRSVTVSTAAFTNAMMGLQNATSTALSTSNAFIANFGALATTATASTTNILTANDYNYYTWDTTPARYQTGWTEWYRQYDNGWADAPVLTPEEQKRRRAAELRAQKRARVLLKAHLPDAEHDQLQRLGYFEVVSMTSGRRYRVYGNSYSRNVVELDAAGMPVNRLCAHGAGRMPLEDHLLAQKLYLETCEDDFRRIANHSRIGKVEAARLVGQQADPLQVAA